MSKNIGVAALGSIGLTLIMMGLFAGCDDFAGLKIPEPGSSCTIDQNQEDTLFGPITSLPVHLFIDPTMDSSRRNDVRRAAEQWNRLSQYSLHQKFFEYSGERALPGVKDYYGGADFCGEHLEEGVFVVAEHSTQHWAHMGYSPRTAGITDRCSGRENKLTPVTHPHIVVYLNSVELSDDLFFGIALHELGHALGLDHSCAANGGGYGAPTCSSLSPRHPYRQAVMKGENDFRAISSGNYTYLVGTPMAHLEQNDIDRAYCLYQNAGLGAK